MEKIIRGILLYYIIYNHGLGESQVLRMMGGSDVSDGKYPYVVSLRQEEHFCGGSIINKRWILTAAHCLRRREPSKVRVVAGTNLLQGVEEQVYQAEKLICHEEYSHVKFINDVGLIYVDKDIEFNDKVQPISLPIRNSKTPGRPAVLTGWGKLLLNGTYSNMLQEITVNTYDQRECTRAYIKHNVTESHLCTFNNVDEGFCKGDSGSPLVAKGVQIGIVSYNKPCGKGVPDVYTRVYSFRNWIIEKIEGT